MNTPIYDFARRYADSDAVRLHMPGHKGVPFLGCEAMDLTEIKGADELFAPEGIIAESERQASDIFGCPTFYSAEGSSLCIRAMLYLAMQYGLEQGRPPVVAAARNVHKTFLTAAALLDFDVEWVYESSSEGYLRGAVSLHSLEQMYQTAEQKPCALYLTSPDYLGNIADITAAAAFCHSHKMLLLVDGAHGAYLHFLPQPMHPIGLGADICCCSAHKTLPVLTGGAYLHFSDRVKNLAKQAKAAMYLFASTSPSYLILESLDLCNAYLSGEYPHALQEWLPIVKQLKWSLQKNGYDLCGTEPMKVTIRPKGYGYSGKELADILEMQQIYAEFADDDYLVLMLTPQNTLEQIQKTEQILLDLPGKPAIVRNAPCMPPLVRAMRIRDTLFAPKERVPAEKSVGRICGEFAVSCPPAVPVVMCGERIHGDAAECLRYYGVQSVHVVCESADCGI
ncbi:MAG: amino acid decarboxylase [Oscillospiraceae bacterium]|nr:amino acid decarboxylase [Oscillospiraceae bacterium]